MIRDVDHLWSLTLGKPYVDATALGGAIEAAVEDESAMDYRTKLLVRDGVDALRSRWQGRRFDRWLQRSPQRRKIERTCACARYQAAIDHDDRGFPSLRRRVVDATRRDDVVEFLSALSTRVRAPTPLIVTGAAALVLGGHGPRHVEHVAIVGEIPTVLRDQHEFREDLAQRFGLRLSILPPHYLPHGWARRVRSIGVLGDLRLFHVNEYDVFFAKLFSRRLDDLIDLRWLKRVLDRQQLSTCVQRVITSPCSPRDRLPVAMDNWYVLFGERLPS